MIEVKIIKEMKQEECYSYTKSGLFISKIIEFLKINNKYAYTPREIMEEIKKANIKSPNPYQPIIKLQTITATLSKAKKSKKITSRQVIFLWIYELQ